MNMKPENICDPLESKVGKRFYVYTPTKFPYQGTLTGFSETELFFEGKDGKTSIFPRGKHDIMEELEKKSSYGGY